MYNYTNESIHTYQTCTREGGLKERLRGLGLRLGLGTIIMISRLGGLALEDINEDVLIDEAKNFLNQSLDRVEKMYSRYQFRQINYCVEKDIKK